MNGQKIEQARAAGKKLLRTLSPSDRFRLIDFSSDVRTFRDEFSYATRENVRAAERYLDDLDAQGSTNISGALDEALAAPTQSGRLPIILFLTDGQPTVGERDANVIANTVSQRRGSRSPQQSCFEKLDFRAAMHLSFDEFGFRNLCFNLAV